MHNLLKFAQQLVSYDSINSSSSSSSSSNSGTSGALQMYGGVNFIVSDIDKAHSLVSMCNIWRSNE